MNYLSQCFLTILFLGISTNAKHPSEIDLYHYFKGLDNLPWTELAGYSQRTLNEFCKRISQVRKQSIGKQNAKLIQDTYSLNIQNNDLGVIDVLICSSDNAPVFNYIKAESRKCVWEVRIIDDKTVNYAGKEYCTNEMSLYL